MSMDPYELGRLLDTEERLRDEWRPEILRIVGDLEDVNRAFEEAEIDSPVSHAIHWLADEFGLGQKRKPVEVTPAVSHDERAALLLGRPVS